MKKILVTLLSILTLSTAVYAVEQQRLAAHGPVKRNATATALANEPVAAVSQVDW